jgi:hypothetical protein
MDQFPKGGQALLADAMIGLLSPLDSLRFMRRKKSVLVIGLAPYLIAIVLYGMLVGRVVTPMLIGFLLEKQLIPVGWATNLMLGAIIWIFALTIFALLGPSVINTLASPIFDRVASHTYEERKKTATRVAGHVCEEFPWRVFQTRHLAHGHHFSGLDAICCIYRRTTGAVVSWMDSGRPNSQPTDHAPA